MLVPLLTLDAVRAARHRTAGVQAVATELLGPAWAAAIMLAHALGFVLSQPAGDQYVYWRFITGGASRAAAVAYHQLIGLLVGTWSGGLLLDQVGVGVRLPVLPPGLTTASAACVGLLAAVGGWSVRRRLAGRAVTAATVGAVLLTLAASVAQRWPFGPARVNLFLLPLIYLLSGAGLAGLWRALVNRGRLNRGRFTGTVLAVSAALVAVLVIDAGVTIGRLHAGMPWHRLDDKVRVAVAYVRQHSPSGAVTVVFMGSPMLPLDGEPWLFYMNAYAYPRTIANAPAIPGSRTVLASWRLTAAPLLLALRGDPTAVVIEDPFWEKPQLRPQDTVLRSHGYRMVWLRGYPGTAWVSLWRR